MMADARFMRKYCDRWCRLDGIFNAAGEVGSAAIQADAANNAADKQYQAAHEANQLQTTVYNDTTTRNKPYYDTGTSALQQLAGTYGIGPNGTGAIDPNAGFYQSPDYQFRLGQGIKGVDAGAAARGMLDSGATRKAEIGYAGNLASGDFNNYASRLMALAGLGQSAANNQATAGQNYASNYGSNLSNAAAAAGNASLAQGSIWGNTLGNLAGQFGSSYGGGGSSGRSSGGINGIFSTGGTFGPAYTGDGNGEW